MRLSDIPLKERAAWEVKFIKFKEKLFKDKSKVTLIESNEAREQFKKENNLV